MVAAKSTVRDPTIVTTIKANGACSKKGEDLINKKTPAVTMVAAWIKADTGVGIKIFRHTIIHITDRTFSSTLQLIYYPKEFV